MIFLWLSHQCIHKQILAEAMQEHMGDRHEYNLVSPDIGQGPLESLSQPRHFAFAPEQRDDSLEICLCDCRDPSRQCQTHAAMMICTTFVVQDVADRGLGCGLQIPVHSQVGGHMGRSDTCICYTDVERSLDSCSITRARSMTVAVLSQHVSCWVDAI